MRLIDADALLKKLEDTSYGYYKTDEYIDGVFAGGISESEIIVMQSPTIEAEPVRHGEWIRKEPNPEFIKKLHELGIAKQLGEASVYWVCSECEKFGILHNKYCPNCGAKMDKKSPENHKKYQEQETNKKAFK